MIEADQEDKEEEFTSFNFKLEELGSRQLVNSWNIKDTLQYKIDLQATHEPDFWQWIPANQILYTGNISIFFE